MHQTTHYLGDGFRRDADGVIRFDEAPEHLRRIEGEGRSHKKRDLAIVAMVALACLALTASALASSKNSIQPGRTFFHTVQSGQHPNRLVTLTNHTGAPRRIKTIAISGSGGFIFTLAANTLLLKNQQYPRCVAGLRLTDGARCVLDVRVHTTRVGWFRSVLRIVYRNGWNNSGSLEAHVVAP